MVLVEQCCTTIHLCRFWRLRDTLKCIFHPYALHYSVLLCSPLRNFHHRTTNHRFSSGKSRGKYHRCKWLCKVLLCSLSCRARHCMTNRRSWSHTWACRFLRYNARHTRQMHYRLRYTYHQDKSDCIDSSLSHAENTSACLMKLLVGSCTL